MAYKPEDLKATFAKVDPAMMRRRTYTGALDAANRHLMRSHG